MGLNRTPFVAILTAIGIVGGANVAAHAEASTPLQGANCPSLAMLQLDHVTITGAQLIPAGTYQPPGSATAFTGLPAFCRVTATISPVPQSSIGIELWLPATTWNEKYQQSGNHGFGGTFYWNEMVPQLQRGYATGITNDGHKAGPSPFDVSWAFGAGANERIIDFAWRSVHELAIVAKQVVEAYYGRPPRYAYFNGCSLGGKEGIKSAQMFPRDFHGIIAGGAASNWTGAANELLVLSSNLVKANIQGPSGAAILRQALNDTTASCDANDGVVDGIINDPKRCIWNSSVLTAAQVDVIKANEATVRDPVTGQYIMSGMEPGSEFDQVRFNWETGLNIFSLGNYQIAYNNPTWNGSTFNLHIDAPVLESALGVINALDPSLHEFRAHGGKLIEWHGWDDAAFTPGSTVRYYREVVQKTSHGDLDDTQNFYRLFMLPGVGHCGTGVGPDDIGGENQTPVSHDPEHDLVSALEAWVEKGIAPQKLIATKFNTVDVPTSGIAMQRPICPYPSEAVYRGSGNTNLATSFMCSQRDRSDSR
jgi:feruloyl esterase